ncbi:exported hypothetical protein [Pseudomonas sp. 8AS]|nr:exported hypothetical protein [Pseudomonas sp. 8AS]
MKRIAPLLLILASLLSPGALADNIVRDGHKSLLPHPA